MPIHDEIASQSALSIVARQMDRRHAVIRRDAAELKVPAVPRGRGYMYNLHQEADAWRRE
jgi:hypothetical protein